MTTDLKSFAIENTTSGRFLGVYNGVDATDAWNALTAAAGYGPGDPEAKLTDDIVITEVKILASDRPETTAKRIVRAGPTRGEWKQ